MLPSSEVISTNSKRCCRTNNSTTNYLFFFKNLDIKKNKNLTNHINNAWDQSMFDDYKRLTDVV